MKKVFGWFLLIIGVLIIFWGIYSSFEIFTAKRSVPEIFKVPTSQEVSIEEKTAKDLQAEMQQQMQQVIREELGKIIPPGFLPKLFNLISWSIFIWILVFAGGKLAWLGIQLLKSTKIVKK